MTLRLPPRIALLVIAAMFVLPLALAWMMYSGAIDFRPVETRNLGVLVQPPVALFGGGPEPADPAESIDSGVEVLSRHWVILHDLPDPCDAACIEAIEGLRQVHRAAGRHQQRIRVAVVLAPGGGEIETRLLEAYSALVLLRDQDGRLGRTLDRVAASVRPGTRGAGSTYLIDPLGHIMMFYESGSDPNNLKKDLKRLLTWSKLDEQ
jgi:hypothetical protein